MGHDPRQKLPGDYDPIRNGLISVFVPQGTLGGLIVLFIALAAALALGLLEGAWLVLGVVGLVALVLLMVRAFRKEMARDSQPRATRKRYQPLPDDAELSDAERREAQRHLYPPNRGQRD